MLNYFKNKMLSWFLGKDIEEQLKNAESDADKVKILMELISTRAGEMAELTEENKKLKEEKEQVEKELKQLQEILKAKEAEEAEVLEALVETKKITDRIDARFFNE